MQRDYVLRMIEQAAAVLREALARVRAGRLADGVRELRRAAQLGGLDPDLLRLCDLPTILQMTGPGGEPDPGRTWVAAETLFVQATAADRAGALAEAASLYARARLLYGLVAPGAALPTGIPEAGDRIREIDDWSAAAGAA